MATSADLNLRGGVAVITGAASGIGAALARSLASRGCDLALVDIDAGGLADTAQRAGASGVRVTTHRLDVTDAAGIASLPEQVTSTHRRVTVLVNNAGVAAGGTFEQVDADDFDWLMNVNFFGTVRMTRAFLPLLARERAAQIVNVSSIFGIIAPPNQTAYCASKFAVRGFSESLRHELQAAGSPIGITLVHPGGVRTAIAANARVPKGADAEQVAREQQAWRSLLMLPAEDAAEQIAHAIEARRERVLIGRDAKQAEWLQRILPVGYWKHAARGLARRIAKASAAEAR